MTNPIGDGARCAQDEEDRKGERLCLKIKAQLEDLLSDRHLAEDGFLLKHVQKKKEGYVSLKLLTCLKQIKVLTTNWHTTLAAAERSALLEVNAEATKVRRVEPLPPWLLRSPTSKLLLASNIAARTTSEGEEAAARGPAPPSLPGSVLRRFRPHGAIASFWFLSPGEEVPKELRCYAKHHKELGQQLCAVVKFDRLSEVRRAYSALHAEETESNGEGMRVVPLGFQSKRPGAEDGPPGGNREDRPGDAPSRETPRGTSQGAAQEEPFAPARAADTCRHQRPVHRPGQGSGFSRQSWPGSGSWCSGDGDKNCSQSPWALSRKFAACALNPAAAQRRNAPYLTQKVLRQPRGPDSTGGFRSRRPCLGSGGAALR